MILLASETKDRCVVLADYMITNHATVRKTAAYYGISKSTVHKDLSERLRTVNHALYNEVKAILDINKAERHIRGGEATKLKYMARNHFTASTAKSTGNLLDSSEDSYT